LDPENVGLFRAYPLIEVMGTAPSEVPELTGITGELQWGGTGNKTLFLTPPSGTVFILR
jgi:hypothetical protein